MERILKIMEYNANHRVMMFWRILFVVFAVSVSLTARGQYADVLKYGSIGELEDFIELCDREIQRCEKDLNSDLARESSSFRKQTQEGLEGWKRWKRDAEKRIIEKQIEGWNERNRRDSELNKRSQEQWASKAVKTTRSGGITTAPTSRATTRTSSRSGTIMERNSASRRKSVQQQSSAAKRSWERRAEAIAEAKRRQKEKALEKELRRQEKFVKTYNKTNAALAPMTAAAKYQVVEQSVVGMGMKLKNADNYWRSTGARVSKGNVDLGGGRKQNANLTRGDRARMLSLLDEDDGGSMKDAYPGQYSQETRTFGHRLLEANSQAQTYKVDELEMERQPGTIKLWLINTSEKVECKWQNFNAEETVNKIQEKTIDGIGEKLSDLSDKILSRAGSAYDGIRRGLKTLKVGLNYRNYAVNLATGTFQCIKGGIVRQDVGWYNRCMNEVNLEAKAGAEELAKDAIEDATGVPAPPSSNKEVVDGIGRAIKGELKKEAKEKLKKHWWIVE